MNIRIMATSLLLFSLCSAMQSVYVNQPWHNPNRKMSKLPSNDKTALDAVFNAIVKQDYNAYIRAFELLKRRFSKTVSFTGVLTGLSINDRKSYMNEAVGELTDYIKHEDKVHPTDLTAKALYHLSSLEYELKEGEYDDYYN